jgi:hypothetical protein
MNRRHGVTAITALFILGAAAMVTLMAVRIGVIGSETAVGALDRVRAEGAADSALAWGSRQLAGKTTADRATIVAIDATNHTLADDGSRFVLSVAYDDPDNDPATPDTVTLTGSGHAGHARRVVRRTVTVVAAGRTPLFADDFAQSDTTFFDTSYLAGTAVTPHGDMAPMTTVTVTGDPEGVFTHGGESPGLSRFLTIATTDEARFSLTTGGCSKIAVGPDGCGPACVNTPSCLARPGPAIPPDGAGYVNYFIVARFRLIRGGFGVYYRMTYPAADPARLTGYIWQYDPGFAYIDPPCNRNSGVFGSDLFGLLVNRRIEGGSETCGPPCAVFDRGAPDGTWPFFCPENRDPWPPMSGWRWVNTDWFNRWRTVYLSVWRDRATIWLGREEIVVGPGSEREPSLVGTVYLGDAPPVLAVGDIGMRLFSDGMVDVGALRVYANDTPLLPADALLP